MVRLNNVKGTNRGRTVGQELTSSESKYNTVIKMD